PEVVAPRQPQALQVLHLGWGDGLVLERLERCTCVYGLRSRARSGARLTLPWDSGFGSCRRGACGRGSRSDFRGYTRLEWVGLVEHYGLTATLHLRRAAHPGMERPDGQSEGSRPH